MTLVALKAVRTLLAAAVIFAIPAYAASSLLPGNTSAEVAPLAGSDDPIRNGLQVVDQPRGVREQTPKADAQPDAVQLNDWIYTGKGKPSPYG